MHWFRSSGGNAHHPYISPIYADVTGLPPTFILTAEVRLRCVGNRMCCGVSLNMPVTDRHQKTTQQSMHYVQVDVLRDEAEDYARKLEAAGVTAGCQRYKGHFHNSMVDIPIMGQVAEDIITNEISAFIHLHAFQRTQQ